MTAVLHIPVSFQSDVERARHVARELTDSLGFGRGDAETVALAVTELATNLVRYARHGELVLFRIENSQGVGVQVESRDKGPGIANLSEAMQDGFSTSGGLGGGLGSVRRLMDDFDITTGHEGSVIVTRKWSTSR